MYPDSLSVKTCGHISTQISHRTHSLSSTTGIFTKLFFPEEAGRQGPVRVDKVKTKPSP